MEIDWTLSCDTYRCQILSNCKIYLYECNDDVEGLQIQNFLSLTPTFKSKESAVQRNELMC